MEIEVAFDRREAEMRIVRKCLVLMMGALVLSVLAVSQVHASCTGSDRISFRDAQCLAANWKNTNYIFGSSFAARNLCPDYGKVVAKIDLKNANDKTWHLRDGETRSGESHGKVRGIHCCRDLGKLCNYSDVVTSGSCMTEFNKSTAADSCTLRLDPDPNGKNCNFVLQCGDSTVFAREEYPNVHELELCPSGSVQREC